MFLTCSFPENCSKLLHTRQCASLGTQQYAHQVWSQSNVEKKSKDKQPETPSILVRSLCNGTVRQFHLLSGYLFNVTLRFAEIYWVCRAVYWFISSASPTNFLGETKRKTKGKKKPTSCAAVTTSGKQIPLCCKLATVCTHAHTSWLKRCVMELQKSESDGFRLNQKLYFFFQTPNCREIHTFSNWIISANWTFNCFGSSPFMVVSPGKCNANMCYIHVQPVTQGSRD